MMKNVACFKGVCTVEEAESLLQWLQDQQRAKVTLKECTHLHAAILQVLMAAKVMVTLPPDDPDLAQWLIPALKNGR
jgi:ribosome maturation factor RimP